MKRLYNFSIALVTLALLGMFSAQQLYAQSAPNLAQAPNIVGGETVTPGAYPWQAALVENGEQFCGGSLITPDWVLTAAHCIEGQASLQVMLGAHTLSNNNESSRQVIDVSEIIAYPRYSSETLDGDIALLKLSKPAILNSSVQTIGLIQNEAAAGTPATVTGWGTTGENEGASDTLREVTVPLVSHAMCNQAYQGDITNNMICAGTGQADKDSCYGDSGGPLVVSDGSNGWLQAGIVSWGAGCALKNSYGVYTNIPQFTDWVQGHLSGNTPPMPPTGDNTDDDTNDNADDNTDDETDNNDESNNEPGEDELEFVDWYKIVAETIGIDVEALDNELDSGKSIADVAKENNVDVQTIIDALQSAEEAFIQQLLDAGKITQEEADSWTAELPTMFADFVNEQMNLDDDPELPEGVEPVDWIEVVAQTIGIDADSLWDELDKEQSIADIANANGVDPQSIIDALVVAEGTFIQQLLDSEYITQEEADEWTATLPEDVAEFVNEVMVYDETGDDTLFDEDEEGEHCDDEHGDADKPEGEADEDDKEDAGDENTDNPEDQDKPSDMLDEIDDSEVDDSEEMLWVDWFEVAAQTLNMDIESLFEALDQGQSIAEIAASNNVNNQTIIDAIISEEQAMIEQGVADGFFSQGEVDEWLADLPEVAAHFIEDSNGYTDVEMIEGVDWFSIAMQTIGIDEESFWTAVEQGQNVAEIAEANGLNRQAVIDAIVQAEIDVTNQEVANGLVNQEDADEWLAELDTFVAEFVDMGFMDEKQDVGWFDIAMQTIGIDEESFWTAVEQGQNVAEIAEANGSNRQAVIDAIVQAEIDVTNQEVASGLVSQSDADEWLAELDAFVAEFVDMGFIDGEMDEEMNKKAGGDGRVTGQAAPNTIKGASMTLNLRKNIQVKTPAAFPNHFIYLPAVMK